MSDEATDSLRQQAYRAFADGRFDVAYKALTELDRQQWGRDAQTANDLAVVLVRLGRLQDAAERFREAQRLSGQEGNLLIDNVIDALASVAGSGIGAAVGDSVAAHAPESSGPRGTVKASGYRVDSGRIEHASGAEAPRAEEVPEGGRATCEKRATLADRSRSRRVVLHIGTHKTGTTAIQDLCVRNATLFSSNGVEYPLSLTNAAIHHYGQHCLAWELLQAAEKRAQYPKGIDDPWDALWSVNASDAEALLLSSENFCRLDRQMIARLADQLPGREVDVIVYLRRQDDYLQALYQTARLHSGYEGSIEDLRASVPMDYEAMLQPWVGQFGRDHVHVRVYEEGRLLGGDVATDFFLELQRLGLLQNVAIGQLQKSGARLNRSFPRACVESALKVAQVGGSEAREGLLALAGEVYTSEQVSYDYLPDTACRELVERYAASNQRVSEHLIGSQAALFRPLEPRGQRAGSADALRTFFSDVREAIMKARQGGAVRSDELDPLPYSEGYPSLLGATGRVDVHSLVAKFLSDSGIKGAYVEFGVGKGRSAVTALRAYTRASVCDRFFLFDSFEGLPELSGPDQGSVQFRKGDYAFSRDEVEQFIARYGASGLAPVQFVQGWFGEQTGGELARVMGDGQVAVVHVDVDLYESCRFVLNAIKPWLRPGVVVLFHDWNCFGASDRFGERRAVTEWLEANPDFRLTEFASYGWHGRSFVFDQLAPSR